MLLKKHKIPFSSTGQFSKLFIDYIQAEKTLDGFYSYAPNIDSFAQAITDRKRENTNRSSLVKVLQSQYAEFSNNEPVASNISKLGDVNTFTVCTGHQLCLFTGPLYFIYKIITTINLTEALNKKYPDQHFVPLYWMASEDHDFQEISSVNVFGKKVSWNNSDAKGAVGRLKTDSLKSVLDELKLIFGDSQQANELTQLFSQAYLNHTNLADATRYLVNELFGGYGLVIIDADDASLKAEFSEIIKDDILNQTNYKLVSESIKKLNALGYDAQVNPREINVFHLTDSDRVRIEKSNEGALNLTPKEYSPNVVLRPLYQQKILPNLAYIGGPGEIAYWLEYKAMFDHHKIMFPILMPRNFAILTDDKIEQQIKKLGFESIDFFKDIDVLNKEFINRNSGAELSLSEEEKKLREVYSMITDKVVSIDQTLKASVDGELQKSLNGLKSMEAKLVRSEKQKQETSIQQIKKTKEKFFPDGMLQERHDNMSPYYLRSGKQFILNLKVCLDPFEFGMIILEI